MQEQISMFQPIWFVFPGVYKAICPMCNKIVNYNGVWINENATETKQPICESCEITFTDRLTPNGLPYISGIDLKPIQYDDGIHYFGGIQK